MNLGTHLIVSGLTTWCLASGKILYKNYYNKHYDFNETVLYDNVGTKLVVIGMLFEFMCPL